MTSNTTDRSSRVGDVGIKAPCRAATTAAITLNGTQTIDTVAVVAGDRVLVKNQSSGVDNGIYVADTGAWQRAADCDGPYDLADGTIVRVNEGTNSGFWYVDATDPITVGTTSITFGMASSTLAVVSAFMQTVLDDTTQRAAQTTLGLATVQPGETLVLNVPGTYSTIQAAMDAAKGYRIMQGGKIQIKVADGTYVLTTSVNFNHVDGHLLEVIGNETTPANVVISVAYTGAFGFDCFVVGDGNVLGKLNGFKFLKSSKAAVIDNTTAILCYNGSAIICGAKIVVDNWYYGIAARDNSMVYCPSASVDHAGDVGIWAYRNSYVYADGATSNNAIDSASGLGYGFQAEYGSTLVCSNGSATGCLKAGVGALSNSIVDAAACVSSTNTGSGFFSNESSTIYASGATCNNNSEWGIDRRDTSTVSAMPTGANNTGNTFGSFSFIPFTKTADFTVSIYDKWLIIDQASQCDITLPNAADYPGRELWIRTIQAQLVVSVSSNVIPRIGGAAGTAILPATDGAWALLVSDGTNWQITASS